jgi:hypothetical protein
MRFRLVYEGNLRAAGNKRTRAPDKWVVRRKIRPQLAGLWATHPTLQGLGLIAHTAASWSTIEAISPHGAIRNVINEPITIGGRAFIPLVRRSLALVCELDILFLRNDVPGSIVKSGGDLDNRIKTLFDGLRIPKINEMDSDSKSDAEPFYCLLEDDDLISSFTVRTDRFLTDPSQSEHRVLLVIEAKVTALRMTAENLAFLSD